MTPADEIEFARVVTAMAAQKPGKPLTPEGIELFWRSMQDWSIEDFKAAAAHLMRTVEFMPSAYHFEQLRKAGEPTAAEAFARARQIVRRLYQREMASHDSGDPRLDAAIRACGGYEALAMCTTENIGFFERRFNEHFAAIGDAEAARSAVPSIAGTSRLAGPTSAASALSRIGHLQ